MSEDRVYQNFIEPIVRRHMSWGPMVELAFLSLTTGKPTQMARLTFEEFDETTHVEPTIRMHEQTAQMLMDQLYAAGFRPTEAVDSRGELVATKAHLADMRALAAHGLQLQLPQGGK
jgi:hypothetical protein